VLRTGRLPGRQRVSGADSACVSWLKPGGKLDTDLKREAGPSAAGTEATAARESSGSGTGTLIPAWQASRVGFGQKITKCKSQQEKLISELTWYAAVQQEAKGRGSDAERRSSGGVEAAEYGDTGNAGSAGAALAPRGVTAWGVTVTIPPPTAAG